MTASTSWTFASPLNASLDDSGGLSEQPARQPIAIATKAIGMNGFIVVPPFFVIRYPIKPKLRSIHQ